MKNIFLFFITLVLLVNKSQAQFTKYLIKLKNKGGNTFTLANPGAYLSQRAIDRRTRYGIAIDSTDLPVTAAYITLIRAIPNVTVLNISKWLNSVSIQTSDAAAITAINALPFVQNVSGLAARTISINDNTDPDGNKFVTEKDFTELPPSSARTNKTTGDFFNYGTNSFNEISLHKGQFLHNIGLRGQGMRVAVIDGGFFHYSILRAMDSAVANGQFLDSFDFVAGETKVFEDDSHGMSCLSTIAANIPGQFIGKAPKANFLLYRTENVAGEFLLEEHNWVCGTERADSAGADIISTSLGYYIQFTPPSVDHPNSDMNGNTTMPAIGGDLAAKKGILVFASIGNDGGNPTATHFLSTPSDGDSVMAVGAVNTAGVVGGFSSFGPSADGQIKPDMSSVGVNALVQTSSNTVGTSNGTSFACPKMAGLATCLWQGFPEFNNMKIANALRQAGSIASSPNDRIGFGIPDVKKALVELLKDFSTANGSIATCGVTINWNSKDVDAMKYEIERKLPGETVYTKVKDQPGKGGVIFSNQSYTFTETLTNAVAGTAVYRIKQIADTAIATFTSANIDSVDIVIGATCNTTGINPPDPNKERLTLIPNPATGSEITLRIETPYPIANMTVTVTDMKGRLMMKIAKSKIGGTANYTLPVRKLAKGKYVVAVYNGVKILASREMIKTSP
jgi:serine protease AprX